MNTELQPVLVLDPVVDVEESYKASEVVYKSGVNKSIYKYTADSYSDQNWIWNNITPPSLNCVVKRDLRIAYSILVANVWTTATGQPVQFNAVNTTGASVSEGTNTSFGCVPRACPIQSSASSVELRLNGSATSTSINDYACIYPHVLSDYAKSLIASEMPLQKDNSALYNNPKNYSIDNGFTDARSPFVPYGTNPQQPSRGSFVWKQITAPTVAGDYSYAVYQLDLVEQLFISPMVWAELMDKSAGLSNLNNLILNIRFADLNRMLSAILTTTNSLQITTQKNISVAVNGTNVSVAGGGESPTLLVEYITQDPILAAKQPQTLVYDYSLVQPFISPCGTWTGTLSSNPSFTAQSLRLASIPSKLYIFARPSKSALVGALAQTTPDTFLRIKSVSINFNNRINLFATYTEADLYSMSVKNGLQDSFNDWKYQNGSICIVDIARDIGLESDETDGQANKYSTLQITATIDSSPLAYAGVDPFPAIGLSYDFYILVEQPGKAFINASECQYILTGPSASEVLKLTSEMEPRVDHTEIEGKGVGGSVFGKVGKLLKSGVNMFKNVNPEHVARGVEMAQGALKSLGLGVAGGAMKKHSRVY